MMSILMCLPADFLRSVRGKTNLYHKFGTGTYILFVIAFGLNTMMHIQEHLVIINEYMNGLYNTKSIIL